MGIFIIKSSPKGVLWTLHKCQYFLKEDYTRRPSGSRMVVFFFFLISLFLNSNAQQFTDVGQLLGVADTQWGYTAAWGDFDGDNDIDLYLVNVGSSDPPMVNLLYRNDVNTSGVFVDVTEQMGVDEPEPSSRGAAWCDVNADGRLDLYVCSNTFVADDSNKLFINQTDFFTDMASQYSLTKWGYNFMGGWGDYDNDGDQDLYLCQPIFEGGLNTLFRNDGGYFTDVTDIYQLHGGRNTSRATWVDFDNDGDQDLFVANMKDSPTPVQLPSRLYRNDFNINGQFVDITLDVGMPDTLSSRDVTVGDYDLDGDLDIYLGELKGNNKYYRNDYNIDGKFTEVAALAGINDSLWTSAVISGDYDNDGDLDIYVANDWLEPNRLYKNETNSSNYLQIRLTDKNGNYNRFGSKAIIYIAGTDTLLGTRVVDGGSGTSTQNAYDCHFGLDPNQAYDIEVIFTTRTDGQNHLFNKFNRPELGSVTPANMDNFLEIRDSVVTVTDIYSQTNLKNIHTFRLYHNYPNPFNTRTIINYELPITNTVDISVYNLLGQKITTLVSEKLPAGYHEVEFNAQNLSSGIYFYRIEAGEYHDVKKMILLK